MKLSLIVLTPGKMEGKTIPIRLPEFLIGRDPQCHLQPASPLVSKRHCALLVSDDRLSVRDFGSTNGTLINGTPIQGETSLGNGDRLKVGPLEFRVAMDASARGSKPTSATPVAKTPDDEAAASVLLLSDDNLTGRSNAAVGSEDIPEKSILRELPKPNPVTDESNLEKNNGGAKHGAAATAMEEITSKAAKALLHKYQRRER